MASPRFQSNQIFRSLVITITIITLFLSGCTGASRRVNVFDEEATAFGPFPLMERSSFEKIDLALELNPGGNPLEIDEGGDDLKIQKENKETLRNAFKVFNELSDDKKMVRRNQIQERIIAASTQRCSNYKQYLNMVDAQTNFGLGTAAVIAGAAGAIFTAADTARSLAGISAIFSGVRAEFNSDYFANKTIQVLTDAFSNRRKEIYKTILVSQKSNITQYNVEAAIKDAVHFHSQCSLIAGLEEAALAVERVNNPGLKEVERALKVAKRIQKTMHAPESLKLKAPESNIVTGKAGKITVEEGGPIKTVETGNLRIATVAKSEDKKSIQITGVSEGETTIKATDDYDNETEIKIKIVNAFEFPKGPDPYLVNESKSFAFDFGSEANKPTTEKEEVLKVEKTKDANNKTYVKFSGVFPGDSLVTLTNKEGGKSAKVLKVENSLGITKSKNAIVVGEKGEIELEEAGEIISPTKSIVIDFPTGKSNKLILTGKSQGTEIVTIANGNKTKFAAIKVTVSNQIKFDKEKLTLAPGEETSTTIISRHLAQDPSDGSNTIIEPSKFTDSDGSVTAWSVFTIKAKPSATVGKQDVIIFTDVNTKVKGAIVVTIKKK